MIKLLQEKTGVARIDTSGNDGVLTLCGNSKAIALAEAAIDELVKKGYTSLAFENFNQAFVMVDASFLPELIGKDGCVIRKLKEQLGAEIELPADSRKGGGKGDGKGKPTGKVKVTIAGTTEAVNKCQEVVNDLITVGHHEITHPGFTHDAVEVEGWQKNFIIGKKGSEIKHIQSNFKVKVQIPHDSPGVGTKPTVIIGEKLNVERAKAYIEKLIWSSGERSGGRGAADKSDDFWGQEEE